MRLKKQTHPNTQNRLTVRTMRNILVAVFLWGLFWMASQYLFIGETPMWLENLVRDVSTEQRFVYLTLWISGIAVVGIALWHRWVQQYGFLRAPRRLYLAYILPVILVVWLLFEPEQFGVSSPIYTTGIVLTTMWQDLVTFGFLQTYLEKQVSPKVAMLITAVVFFVGHTPYGMPLAMLVAYGLGFLVFAYLRYKTKSVYLTNVLHLSFVLIPM
jgi:membrane protease YdiL (CAAX protease family)